MIVINKRKNGFTVEGHANFAECGKDIVCAGVSTLAQNFIASVEKLTVCKGDYIISDGFLDVEIEKLTVVSEALLASFYIGVEMIIEEYPEYVRLI